MCVRTWKEINILLESAQLTATKSARNLGVMIDDQLTFKVHVASTARSCRFAPNNIGKIRLYLSEHIAHLLVQGLIISSIDYCNSLLAGLPPACTFKPLQMIQNHLRWHIWFSFAYKLQPKQLPTTWTHLFRPTLPPAHYALARKDTWYNHHNRAPLYSMDWKKK